jgi:di- and tripeptidase
MVPAPSSDTFSNGGNTFFDRPRNVTAASLPTLDNGQRSSRDLGGLQATFRRWAYKAFAHAGYIYSMLLVKGLFHHSPDDEVLITCAGDGSVKLWGLDSLPEGLLELDKFKNEDLSALSMAYSDGFLYVGMSDGKAMVCNLDSRQILQILDVKCADVGAVQVVDGHLLCGTNGGYVKVSTTSSITPRDAD